MAVLLILLVVMGVVPTAQGQDMQGPSWEMGWVTDVDPKYTVELEEDWDLFGELCFQRRSHRSES